MSPRSKTSKKVKPSDRLKEQLKEVETCFGTSCNMCERDCPIYRVSRNRTLTSRAKNRSLLFSLKGHYPLGKEFAKAIYTCNMCGMCDARCALGNTERFGEIRRFLAANGLTTEDQDRTVDTIKATGDVYGRSIDTVSMFKDHTEGDMPVYIGCTYKSFQSEVEETFQVLEALGVKPKVGKEICCGNVVDLMGFESEFEEIKEAFRESWPYDEFLTICPSCTHVFRKHYDLKAKHVVELVHENLDTLRDKVDPLDLTVTYHDPCDLGRRMGIYDEPRKILEAIGVNIVEMSLNREFSLCCGAGGGLLVYDNELAEEVGKNRMRMAADTGTDMLVTACPTCETQLTTCTMLVRKEIGRRIKIASIWGLVKKALR